MLPLLATLCLLLAAGVQAQQGPAQPAPEQQQEAPDESEASEPPAEAPSPDELRDDVAHTVEGLVELQSEKEGFYRVRDEKLKKDWKLKLTAVPPEQVVVLDPEHLFSMAQFKSTDGKHAVALDFYLRRPEDGGYEQDQVLIRSVDGKDRYEYDKDHKRVPPKAPGAARKNGAKKKAKKKARGR